MSGLESNVVYYSFSCTCQDQLALALGVETETGFTFSLVCMLKGESWRVKAEVLVFFYSVSFIISYYCVC